MNCNKAKQIDLVSYLKKQGFKTGKTTSNEVWFYSPFRGEKTPSFKVDYLKNVWIDFIDHKGGTIIDFVMIYNNCSIAEALSILSKDSFSFHQQPKYRPVSKKPTYSIKKITELTNQRLLDYLINRKIDLQFAKRFCFQVYYSFSNGKELYGIGFMNDVGGIEIVNIYTRHYRKICLGKKEITTINNNSNVVSLFESWSDYLSYLTLKKQIPQESFIILNSTSLAKKAISLLHDYSIIKTFFDNDEAGDIATNLLIENYQNKVIDNRIHYKSYDDLNDYLMKPK
ncbi:toprim domain-containing protein [Cellulophaga sp. HaHaR_3_176]|uniref:toprim domain-containing protein n=1 Tax=Cellulophaga sp. HaHaR_3_176 TaxID=1942464 RepID=UPI001C1FB1F8|nr:toprim domain-containing protein [Cellulophaga sp. HaHaR_3_176]QWX83578.1 toprim domain-containing protein [Cellulophaga sp. HaHaR_3_176]